MRRVVRPGGVVAVCMWDSDGMDMLAAVNRTQAVLGPSAGSTEADAAIGRSEEIEQLFGADGVESDSCSRSRPATRASTSSGRRSSTGAGPAGEWASRSTPSSGASARAELYRQVGEPERPFSLARARVGGARYARVRTLLRSAPVPTSVTSTSSPRSTNST